MKHLQPNVCVRMRAHGWGGAQLGSHALVCGHLCACPAMQLLLVHKTEAAAHDRGSHAAALNAKDGS